MVKFNAMCISIVLCSLFTSCVSQDRRKSPVDDSDGDKNEKTDSDGLTKTVAFEVAGSKLTSKNLLEIVGLYSVTENTIDNAIDSDKTHLIIFGNGIVEAIEGIKEGFVLHPERHSWAINEPLKAYSKIIKYEDKSLRLENENTKQYLILNRTKTNGLSVAETLTRLLTNIAKIEAGTKSGKLKAELLVWRCRDDEINKECGKFTVTRDQNERLEMLVEKIKTIDAAAAHLKEIRINIPTFSVQYNKGALSGSHFSLFEGNLNIWLLGRDTNPPALLVNNLMNCLKSPKDGNDSCDYDGEPSTP